MPWFLGYVKNERSLCRSTPWFCWGFDACVLWVCEEWVASFWLSYFWAFPLGVWFWKWVLCLWMVLLWKTHVQSSRKTNSLAATFWNHGKQSIDLECHMSHAIFKSWNILGFWLDTGCNTVVKCLNRVELLWRFCLELGAFVTCCLCFLTYPIHWLSVSESVRNVIVSDENFFSQRSCLMHSSTTNLPLATYIGFVFQCSWLLQGLFCVQNVTIGNARSLIPPWSQDAGGWDSS